MRASIPLLAALLATAACRAAATPGGAATVPANGGGMDDTIPAAAGVATVQEVVDGSVPAGARVRVTGRCLPLSATRAAGPPPRTRSDWQLADATTAIWVVGPRPAGCSVTEGATRDDTITARVAQDTVRVMATDSGKARRYLVRVD